MPSSTKSPRESLRNHVVKTGKIQQWAKVLGLQMLEDAQGRQAKNEEAENQAFRRMVGSNGGTDESSEGDDEMRTTILGDITVTHPAPPAPAPPKQSSLPLILAGAAATLFPAIGIGGLATYLLMKDSQPPLAAPVEFDDESLKIGLGRIEDYLKETTQ